MTYTLFELAKEKAAEMIVDAPASVRMFGCIFLQHYSALFRY